MEADLRAADGDKTAKARRSASWSPTGPRPPGIDSVVFDRAGNKYHGRVAALADGAREGGPGF